MVQTASISQFTSIQLDQKRRGSRFGRVISFPPLGCVTEAKAVACYNSGLVAAMPEPEVPYV